MQAIEFETRIDENGQVTLPVKYRTAYGRRARVIILLQDETEPVTRRRPGSAIGKLTILSEDDDHLKDCEEYMP